MPRPWARSGSHGNVAVPGVFVTVLSLSRAIPCRAQSPDVNAAYRRWHSPVSSATTEAARRGWAPASTSRRRASRPTGSAPRPPLRRPRLITSTTSPSAATSRAARPRSRARSPRALALGRRLPRAPGAVGQQRACPARGAATRRPREFPRARTAHGAGRPSCAGGSRGNAIHRPAGRRPPSAVIAADGPGSTSTGRPAATQPRTSR